MQRLGPFVAIVVFFAPNLTGADPILPPSISIGTLISGFFSFDTGGLLEPDRPGHYAFAGPDNMMSVTVGERTFSTSFVQPNALVRVTDGSTPGNADFIQISSKGDAASFSPFLDNFDRQDPELNPYGELNLNFHFPNTYLSSDALPTSIDPLQTVGPLPGSSFENIFGGVEGVSTFPPDPSLAEAQGWREWVFFFLVNPIDIFIVQNGTTITGAFTGHIVDVEAGEMSRRPATVPEPGSLSLLCCGILTLLTCRKSQGGKH